MVLTFLSEKNNQGAIKNAPPSMCRKKDHYFSGEDKSGRKMAFSG